MSPQNAELRIIRLEEEVYFLGERVKSLDDLVVKQQEQFDAIEKNLKSLAERLKDIQEALSEQHSPKADIPPHHEPRLW